MKEKHNIPDPFSFYKQCSSMAEESMAKVLEKTLATEFFAETMGKQLEGYLSLLDIFKNSSDTYLENLPLPTEQDIHRIAGQITALEEKIDFLEDGIDCLQEKLETVLTYLSDLSPTHEKISKQNSDSEGSE